MDAKRPAEGLGLFGHSTGEYPTTMVVSERWDQIGEACQQPRKLTGLTIRDVREGIHIKEMGMAGDFRVTDLGMSERPNSHSDRHAKHQKWREDWLAGNEQLENCP